MQEYNLTIVTITYSFDAEVVALIFDDYKKACDFIKEDFEKLKRELFDWGYDYIEEFLGYEINYDWEKDTLDNLMDEAYKEMPKEELETFYQKFCIE